MLKRLFIILPLYILFFLFIMTLILPIIYWVIIGKHPLNLSDHIDNI